MKQLLLFSVLSFVFVQSSLASIRYNALPADGHVQFLAIGKPAMMRIRGESSGPEGFIEIADKQAKGEFKLNLSFLDTGIEMRDRHMKEKYLEIEKSPDAKVTIDPISLTDLNQSKDVRFTGSLLLHNTTQKIQGQLSFESKDKDKTANAEFKIKLSDFGIDIPTYAGIKVADEVEIKINLSLKQQNL